ncbi:maleylacetoacetate isomerase [Alteromonas gilva]|uniref:Maleylacetoacetate isomerase n=1 Tax=Alteromonas gilva TaxID=2987522 RepID=A0ABT5L3Q9_9ALTE|nr:maleylacetoacetate isomerase [Alteromonas gilva]MDC8831675.1 maleylacetoacetate isomerase [Alteromonas gilva]
MSLKLYGYWRSSASYRVRIALNLKGLEYEYIAIDLKKDGGQQHSAQYDAVNPAHLVPTFVDDDEDIILNQSLSIIEYLDERYREPYPLLPAHSVEKARIRALAQDIACDIQPLANLRVLTALQQQYELSAEHSNQWASHWITKGLSGIERRLQTQAGRYCFGFDVTLADVCLVPQVYAAKRFNVDMTPFPLISRIYHQCQTLQAFQKAQPEEQADCP